MPIELFNHSTCPLNPPERGYRHLITTIILLPESNGRNIASLTDKLLLKMAIERPNVNVTNHLIEAGLILKIVPDNGTVLTIVDAFRPGKTSL